MLAKHSMTRASARWVTGAALLALVVSLGCGDDDARSADDAGGAGNGADADASDAPPSTRDGGSQADADTPSDVDASAAVDGGAGGSGAADAGAPVDDAGGAKAVAVTLLRGVPLRRPRVAGPAARPAGAAPLDSLGRD